MLVELLQAVQEAGYISKAALAGKLGKPVSLIEAGLVELTRLGYLQENQGFGLCQLPCPNCPYASLCRGVPLKTVLLTDKGQKLLKALD